MRQYPLHSMGRLMALAALLALDLWVIRESFRPDGWADRQLVAGSLPMANVLVLVGLVSIRRHGHPFVTGFVGFGTAALTSYVIATILLGSAWASPYLRLVLEPLLDHWDRSVTSSRWPIFLSLIAVMLSLPQLIFALAGGLIATTMIPRSPTIAPDLETPEV